MISVENLSLNFGSGTLFKEVNIQFLPGNCYGIIGANGAGKSTFLKILSGELDSYSGAVQISKRLRISVLKQDQFAYDDHSVLDTVIMGNIELYNVMKEREELYSKSEMTDDEGMRVAELEGVYGEMGGYESESSAGILLSGLGISQEFHSVLMAELEGNQKFRVLLAQALFGNPDILLLDEPTNHLDLESINWLEEFLSSFENIVIVVSHDRHFLNQVCTHICDIDFMQIRSYAGNYDFWYQASQYITRQKQNELRRTEEQAKKLREFIQKFSSNASKSKQAMSRKRILDKLDLDELPTSTRRSPYIEFKPNRNCGKEILSIQNLNFTSADGEKLFTNLSFTINNGDKIALIGPLNQHKQLFFDLISGEIAPKKGQIDWGTTIRHSYLPSDNSRFFGGNESIIEWLQGFYPELDEAFLRSYLGRMLFSGDDALKPVKVLSGGEKMRCMITRIMLSGSNVIMLNEPTNHLDLESISSLNNALIKFPDVLVFNSHDHEFISTVANRIVEFTPAGVIDRSMPFEDYLENQSVANLRDKFWHGHQRVRI